MSERLDLLTLRLVIAVAESGSISAGSDRLQLAVAAGSARISSLEAALGIRIFERSPRGVELTTDGLLLVQRGRELLIDADKLVNDLRDLRLGLAGHVRVLANASALLQVLPARLHAFSRGHPDIRVDVEERISPEIATALLEGRADLGIMDRQTPSPGLEFHPFFQDRLALVVPRGHALAGAGPVRLADVVDQQFIVLTGHNAVSTRLFNAASMVGQSIQVAVQVLSFDSACRMVAAGHGIAVLPCDAIVPQLRHLPLEAVALAEDWADRTHYLALRTGNDAPAAARTLAQALLRG